MPAWILRRAQIQLIKSIGELRLSLTLYLSSTGSSLSEFVVDFVSVYDRWNLKLKRKENILSFGPSYQAALTANRGHECDIYFMRITLQ